MPPDLSIVIPAYSEERRIGASLDELSVFLKKDGLLRTLSVEVIVVVADSIDNTKSIVTSKQNKIESLSLLEPGPRVGKGRDTKFGMLAAKGEIVIFMDADLATPLRHIPSFYKEIKRGNREIVIGTRNLLKYRNNKLRGLLTVIVSKMYQFLGSVKVEDTQCGFKMFTKASARACFTRLTIMGWGFDMELLAIARIKGFPVKAIRIEDWKHMPYSTHTDGIPRILIRLIRDHSLILYNSVTGKYN